MFTEDKMTAVSVSYMQASLRIIKNKNACERMHAPTHTHRHRNKQKTTGKKKKRRRGKQETKATK